ncbi:MAG: hypothetical protein RL757_3380 [Bacteroidota bacterium]|jgi:hypothetical protein
MKKNLSRQLLALLSAAVIGFIIVQACGKVTDVTKDVVLSVDNDLVRIPLSIQFFDPSVTASGEAADQARDMKNVSIAVKLVGTGVEKLYNTAGQRLSTLGDLKGGAVDVAMKKTDWAALKNTPLTFSLVAEAPGYLRTVKTFTLNDTVTRFETMSMVNLTGTTPGIKVTTSNAVVTSNASGAVPTTTTIQADSAKIVIPAGTVLKDKNGAPLTGALNVQLVQFSPSSQLSADAFPGGFNPEKIRGTNGQDLGAGTFTSLGFIALDMTVGNTPVKQFGGSINVTVDIASTLKSDDGTPVRAGMVVPIWSLNEETGDWQQEQSATIVNNGGKLQAVLTQTHLSFWNLDFCNFKCRNSQTFTFPSNITIGNYWVELMNGATGQVISGQWTRIDQGVNRNLTIRYPPAFPDMYFKIYQQTGNVLCNRGAFVESQHFNVCSGPIGAPVSLTTSTPGNVTSLITVIASGTCASQPNVTINPTLTIMYRPSGCYYWAPLGTMVNGVLAVNIETRKSYDFKVTMGGTTQYFINKTVPPELRYILPTIVIPQNYCAAFGF